MLRGASARYPGRLCQCVEGVGSQCAPVQRASVLPITPDESSDETGKPVARSSHREGITGYQGARLERTTLGKTSMENVVLKKVHHEEVSFLSAWQIGAAAELNSVVLSLEVDGELFHVALPASHVEDFVSSIQIATSLLKEDAN